MISSLTIIDENILNKILIEANKVLKMHHDQLGFIQGVERRFSTRRSNFLNHLWDHGEDCEASRVNYLSRQTLPAESLLIFCALRS